MIAYHCDRDGCDSWQRMDSTLPGAFLILSDEDEDLAHFCCLDCCMHWSAAHSEPTALGKLNVDE